MSDQKEKECTHPSLHFDQGGFYVVCSKCKRTWQGVDGSGITPDFDLRKGNLSNFDIRTDPYRFGE